MFNVWLSMFNYQWSISDHQYLSIGDWWWWLFNAGYCRSWESTERWCGWTANYFENLWSLIITVSTDTESDDQQRAGLPLFKHFHLCCSALIVIFMWICLLGLSDIRDKCHQWQKGRFGQIGQSLRCRPWWISHNISGEYLTISLVNISQYLWRISHNISGEYLTVSLVNISQPESALEQWNPPQLIIDWR